ncbi:3'(2'),5'-bisphosphate nucleotidase CysQ [Serratia symbiotica]|uniref:3'(2'),5'-bisphosphate nucleotidase CysQ n=2 Tax=Serratia symbiotica TaxID=138074 RepID=A0A068Z7T5_9GAMM|nr:3'(2'),5'-bisphosphate nucleotidase CysQ [Serratia symbiotica]MBF1995642.1 3'(2'),5'-bisphosphate nucleotidase CysQ [Serratia symbiotica]MBQ0955648.1 3'(2'),5'-bisphosphate nucleotidase CysQ [Serratia symbiotica]QLH64239.1 3'(2'),5'-bisphosphate nucleotidase CysQ [Serratia symbiotica]QTP15787.1 3'(2'),5'-bisphosphate nucleotidase CysQ [Serratia symbiotica]CDG47660.1 3'(2'),5'-bisphosphate nucleotidase CysQ [Serratia symbiotica SCt-VLC]
MLAQICQLSRAAGAAIMAVYDGEQPLNIEQKKDHSPVTTADLAAHHIIKCGLAALTPEVPLLSEEDPPAWEERQNWARYWLVDPLDGTKEFLHRNGEFTVNIALIEHGEAVMGVVYAPAIDVLYLAEGNNAWKEEKGQRKPITVSNAQPPLVVVSRSHIDDELKDYLNQLGEHQTIAVGSSLKFCLVAEGKAQLYPRFGPTNIWDTAAGHAVAAAAGAQIHDWQGKPLIYAPRESLLNPGFRVSLF